MEPYVPNEPRYMISLLAKLSGYNSAAPCSLTFRLKLVKKKNFRQISELRNINIWNCFPSTRISCINICTFIYIYIFFLKSSYCLKSPYFLPASIEVLTHVFCRIKKKKNFFTFVIIDLNYLIQLWETADQSENFFFKLMISKFSFNFNFPTIVSYKFYICWVYWPKYTL